MMTAKSTAGAAMKLAITLFVLAVLATAGAGVGVAAWTGHIGRHDAMRSIHYDSNYDVGARRRVPGE